MHRLIEFIKAQKVGIFIGMIVSVTVIGIGLMAFASDEKILEKESTANTEQEQANFVDALETSDFGLLGEIIETDVALVEIENDICCTIHEEVDVITKVIEFLQINVNLKTSLAEDTDAEEILAESTYNYKEYTYLATSDGKSWLGFKTGLDGKVSEIILRHPPIPTEEITTDDITEEPEQPVQQPVASPYLEFSGVVQDSVVQGKKYITFMTFISHNGVPAGTVCTFTRNSTLTNGTQETSSNSLVLKDDYTSQLLDVYAGVHNFSVDCVFNNQPYTKSGTVTINEIPLTVCDTKEFELGENVATFEDLKDGLVGVWRGCAHTPFGGDGFSYGVEITFRADGSYSSRNYDLQLNNGSLSPKRPLHPAFYYGIDQDDPQKTFTLDTFTPENGAVGVIVIAYNSTSSATDILRDFKVSTDGQRLTFGFIHNGKYGPIVYELDKVAN